MRWLYIPDEDDPDFIAKQATITRIEKWWHDFESIGLGLFEMCTDESRDDIEDRTLEMADWIAENVQLIHPEIMWEIQPGTNGGHLFVVTSEGNFELTSLIQTVVDMAPKLDYWNFSRHRLPIPLEDLEEYLQAKSGVELPADLRVSWKKNLNNKIELKFYSKNFSQDIEEDMFECLHIGNAFLGEEFMDNWIDVIEPVKPTSTQIRLLNSVIGKSSSISHNMNQLLQECFKLRQQILDRLPTQYISEIVLPAENESVPHTVSLRMPNAEGGVDEIKPSDLLQLMQEKFPKLVEKLESMKDDTEEDDEEEEFSQILDEIRTQSNAKNEIKKFDGVERLSSFISSKSLSNGLSDGLYFRSENHSRFGEKFCYIETAFFRDETDQDEDDYGSRDRLKKKLDAALREQQLGCTVGYGFGTHGFYIDLVLTDVNKAIPTLRKIAMENNLSQEAWLRFYDTHLQKEWVGLHPDSKSPFEPRQKQNSS